MRQAADKVEVVLDWGGRGGPEVVGRHSSRTSSRFGACGNSGVKRPRRGATTCSSIPLCPYIVAVFLTVRLARDGGGALG